MNEAQKVQDGSEYGELSLNATEAANDVSFETEALIEDSPLERKLVVASNEGEITPEYLNVIGDTPEATDTELVTEDTVDSLTASEQVPSDVEQISPALAYEVVSEETETSSLRKNFNIARDNYHEALHQAYSNRSMFTRSANWVGQKSKEVVNVFRNDSDPNKNEEGGYKLSDEEKEYYRSLPFGSRIFGAGRSDLPPQALAAKQAFDEANKALYEFKKESGIYEKLIARGMRADNSKIAQEAGILPASNIPKAIADRHVLKPAEQRLDLQSAHLPESLRKLKDGLVKKMQEDTGTAKLVKSGILAATFVSAYLNPVKVGVGMTARYLSNKLYLKPKIEREQETKKNIVGSILGESMDLDAQEKAYFERIETVHEANKRSRIATAAAVLAVGGLSANNVFAADEATNSIQGHIKSPTPDTHTDIVPRTLEDDLGSIISNIDKDVSNQGVFDPNKYIASQEDLNRLAQTELEGLRTAEVTKHNLEAGQELHEIQINRELNKFANDEPAFVNETVDNHTGNNELTAEGLGHEKIIHHVERGQNLSTEFSNKIRTLTDSGEYRLPSGLSRDEIVHRMYQAYPEMTKAHGAHPTWTVQDWKDVGVSSGNPNLIYPTDNINMSVMMAKMGVLPNVSDVNVSPVSESSFTGDLTPIDVKPEYHAPANLPTEQVATSTYSEGQGVVATTQNGAPVRASDIPVSYKTLPDGSTVPVTLGEVRKGILEMPSGDNYQSGSEGNTTWNQETHRDTTSVSGRFESVTRYYEGLKNAPGTLPNTDVYKDVGAYFDSKGNQIISKEIMNYEVTKLNNEVEFKTLLAKAIHTGVETKKIVLPSGATSISEEQAASFVGVTLDKLAKPEFDGVRAILTEDTLKEAGISSGNIHIIKPTDTINVGELLKQIFLDRTISTK